MKNRHRFAHRRFTLFLWILLLSTQNAFGGCWQKTYSTDPFIGPEIYYMKREKEGGSQQTGVLYGVRAGYDRVQRSSCYWGIDGLWAQGPLEGKNTYACLKSEFTDANVEARVGYTFQSKNWRCASFSPYTGLGYFWEKNHYVHPSPLHVHFDNTFSYIPIGFLSQVFLTPQCSIGLNLKFRYILEGEQKVTHDSNYGALKQHYDEKLQYRIELPLTYFFCWRCHSFGCSIVPFYEVREYGHRANFPFDFLETKLTLYGATLKLAYLF